MRDMSQAALVVLHALFTANAAAVAQPYSQEPLPPESQRVIVGTWRLIEPDVKCTRSIERVDERYYMVARCSDMPGVNGSRGFPLTRVSERVYRNQVGATFEIQTDGMLFMVVSGNIDMRGRPQKELWPQ
jgi:hypothetical protein